MVCKCTVNNRKLPSAKSTFLQLATPPLRIRNLNIHHAKYLSWWSAVAATGARSLCRHRWRHHQAAAAAAVVVTVSHRSHRRAMHDAATAAAAGDRAVSRSVAPSLGEHRVACAAG